MKIQEINHQHCQKWIIGLQSQFHFQTLCVCVCVCVQQKKSCVIQNRSTGGMCDTHMMNGFKVLGKLLPCHVVYCFTIFSSTFCTQRKGKISIGIFLTFDPLFILTMQCRKLQLCTYRNRQYFSLLDCSWTKSYRKSTEQKLVTKIQMLRLKGANCTVIENCWNKSHIGSTLQGGSEWNKSNGPVCLIWLDH